MKGITKSSILKMMEQELQNHTSGRSITKNKIKKMMEEELAKLKEGRNLHDEGLREMISDFLSSEISTWHGVAKAEFQQHVEANGFDLSQEVLQALSVGGAKLQELGPGTGHVEGTDPAGVVRQVADDLSEMSDIMSDAPSTTTASEFAGAIQSLSQELVQAADELKIDGPRPAHEGLSEARKRPLKRDREAFDRNTRMVSDLQKTISSYLKESGAKLNKNHTAVIEKISTRLMHIANSPMIKLSEGDSNSRMISGLEKIGEEIKGIAHMSVDPAVLNRLELVEEMIQQLWQDMMGVQ